LINRWKKRSPLLEEASKKLGKKGKNTTPRKFYPQPNSFGGELWTEKRGGKKKKKGDLSRFLGRQTRGFEERREGPTIFFKGGSRFV